MTTIIKPCFSLYLFGHRTFGVLFHHDEVPPAAVRLLTPIYPWDPNISRVSHDYPPLYRSLQDASSAPYATSNGLVLRQNTLPSIIKRQYSLTYSASSSSCNSLCVCGIRQVAPGPGNIFFVDQGVKLPLPALSFTFSGARSITVMATQKTQDSAVSGKSTFSLKQSHQPQWNQDKQASPTPRQLCQCIHLIDLDIQQTQSNRSN